jgi:hypothetical protein
LKNHLEINFCANGTSFEKLIIIFNKKFVEAKESLLSNENKIINEINLSRSNIQNELEKN